MPLKEVTDPDVLAAIQGVPKQATQQVDYDPTEGMSGFDKFAAGLGKSVYDTGRGIGQLLGMVSQEEIESARQRDAALMNTGAGLAGNIVGHAGQVMLPGGAMMAGGKLANSAKMVNAGRAILAPQTAKQAALVGAGYSALQPGSMTERATSAALGGAGGAAGQKVGKYIARGAGSASQYMRDVANKARKYGAMTTPGATTQNTAMRQIEASMASHPATANKMASIKEANQSALNRVAAQSIGENTDEITEHTLGSASERIGKEFERVFSGKEINLGDDFLDDLVSVESKYTRSITGRGDSTFNNVRDYLLDEIGEGKISGDKLLSIRNELSQKSRSLWGGQNPNPELAQAIDDVIDSLDDAAKPFIPKADREAYREARRQWANLKAVESSIKGKDVSGPKMANYLKRKDKGGYLRGKVRNEKQKPLYDMVRFSDLYRDIVGDSGTATRMALPMMAGRMVGGSGIGAAANYLTGGDPLTGAIVGGSLMGVGVPAAMKLGQSAYLMRPTQALLTQGGLLGRGVNPAIADAAQSALTYGPVGLLSANR